MYLSAHVVSYIYSIKIVGGTKFTIIKFMVILALKDLLQSSANCQSLLLKYIIVKKWAT